MSKPSPYDKKRKRSKIDHDSPVASTSSSLHHSFPRTPSTSFPRSTSRLDTDKSNDHVDLDTTEVKNGESIAALRKMVLGKMEFKDSQTVLGKYIAIDCEMVGVGIDGDESSLARVSVVNYTGAVMLDVFVRQRERVVDYRTQWSGVRSSDLSGTAKSFEEVQKIVAELIKDRILVGHAVHNDLKALLLSHPSPQIRDTQSLAFKYRIVKSRRPALRVLVRQELGITIQGGEHSSVTDARATMALFRIHKKQFESGYRPLHTRDKDKSNTQTTDKPFHSSTSISKGKKRKREESELDSASESELKVGGRASSPKPLRSSSSPTPRKGTSSGLSTVIRRANGAKEIRGKSPRGHSNRKGNLETKKPTKSSGGEKWWSTLGTGKKGSVRL